MKKQRESGENDITQVSTNHLKRAKMNGEVWTLKLSIKELSKFIVLLFSNGQFVLGRLEFRLCQIKYMKLCGKVGFQEVTFFCFYCFQF